MSITIFYSWQSDIPPKVNRNFIEDGLEKVVKKLGKEISIQEALRDQDIEIDKDTKGVPGIPPIADVIFSKIDKCGIFVPDLTFVGKSKDERLLSNPNVLIEYGWALKALSYSRIIPIMNVIYGDASVENLPFDMRHLRRPITYSLSPDSDTEERSKVKKQLVQHLLEAIELIIKNDLFKDFEPKEKTFIEIPTTTNPSNYLKAGEKIINTGIRRITEDTLYLPEVERLFLRIIPSSPLNIRSNKEAADLSQSGELKPMNFNEIDGWSYGRNKYGGCACYSENGKILNITQLFKSGELWGIDSESIGKQYLMDHAKVDFGYFPCKYIERVFNTTLENYLKFVSETLKLPLPVKLVAGATDVEGYRMSANLVGMRFTGYVVEPHIVYESIISDYFQKTAQILRPFFEYLWEECGLNRPDVENLNDL